MCWTHKSTYNFSNYSSIPLLLLPMAINKNMYLKKTKPFISLVNTNFPMCFSLPPLVSSTSKIQFICIVELLCFLVLL